MGSNLYRKKLTREGLRDMQLAVARMNRLARGLILPNDIETARRSIYELAELDYPLTAKTAEAEEWSRCVRAFIEIPDPSQIQVREVGGYLSITIQKSNGGGSVTIRVPRDGSFVPHANKMTESMRRILSEHPTWGPADVMSRHLAIRIADEARQFDIPDHVARAAIKNLHVGQDEEEATIQARLRRLHQVPLTYRMACEYQFYYRRATNRETPRPVELNDG